jgi:hypothetical protein
MNELLIVDLLDERPQDLFRQALVGKEFDAEMQMQAESIAALALVGQHPPKLRSVALAIMPDPARRELDAHSLIVPTDGQGIAWALTEKGKEMAEMLAAAIPERSAEQRKRDAEQLKALMGQAQEALRKRERP